MMRGSAGGWVGGRTVTVITRDVTASGGLRTGLRSAPASRCPDPVRNPKDALYGGQGTRIQVQGWGA